MVGCISHCLISFDHLLRTQFDVLQKNCNPGPYCHVRISTAISIKRARVNSQLTQLSHTAVKMSESRPRSSGVVSMSASRRKSYLAVEDERQNIVVSEVAGGPGVGFLGGEGLSHVRPSSLSVWVEVSCIAELTAEPTAPGCPPVVH